MKRTIFLSLVFNTNNIINGRVSIINSKRESFVKMDKAMSDTLVTSKALIDYFVASIYGKKFAKPSGKRKSLIE